MTHQSAKEFLLRNTSNLARKPSSDPCHPDYIPSIYMRTADSSLKGAKRLNRYNSAQKRKFGLVKNSNASKKRKIEYEENDENGEIVSLNISGVLVMMANDDVDTNELVNCTPVNDKQELLGFAHPLQESERKMLMDEIDNLRSEKNMVILITSRWTPAQIRKRKLFSDSTSQVTPKKKKVSIGIQSTPAIQKYTQVTPKQKRSAKASTDISISAETQTEAPSLFCLKSKKTTQTDYKITCEKSSQVNISKIENLKSSDKELKRYTGIEDYKLFTILHKYLASCCSHTECETIPGHGDPNKLFSHINLENQLLVLYKLKRNPVDPVLA
ncbi:hypothetical protein CHS0354_008089 [Potamilus streckersoni]|uniref:Uncharacterized protein n=1 Tax=Potamilus streckersoni TaxID=2493646 RepID=A0AAE0T074_9BIVA|nr:hypothetical protein CHS0354_008089 [Potamilus streckersoni]